MDQHTIGVHGDLVRRVHRGNKIVIQRHTDGMWIDISKGAYPDTAFDRSRNHARRLQISLERAASEAEKVLLR